MFLWTNRKEAHFRLSSARLLNLVKAQSESQEKTGSTLLWTGSSVDLLRLFPRQRNQAGIGVFWRETSCTGTWAGWRTSWETGDMEVAWALVVWRHDHRVHLSSADSWKFTAQWKAEPTAQLLRFWGRSLVITDWIHQRQHDGSPHPPSRGESPNKRKDISLRSRFRVLWIRGVFCLDRFLYWLVLTILSWTFPCPTHSAVVTPTQAGKLSPKGNRFTLVSLPHFCLLTALNGDGDLPFSADRGKLRSHTS